MNNIKEDGERFEGNFEDPFNMVSFLFGFYSFGFFPVLVMFCYISFEYCVHALFSLLISISNNEYVIN